jgi:23S rRNA pseudouridine1911/1915/1917 synthase
VLLTERLRFLVRDPDAALRLDQLVARHLPFGGRRLASQLFRERGVRVDGQLARRSERARPGAEVTIDLPPSEVPVADPTVPLVLRLERTDLLVVDKPAAVPTAPLGPGERGTLANALVARYPETIGVGHRAREPGLVHRLDTGTSGLILVARSKDAFDRLHAALVRGDIDKRYLAVVAAAGLPGEGVIDEPLRPAGPRGARVAVAAPGAPDARAACSAWRKVRTAGAWAIVEVTAPRAYRHQVRAHLAHIGHPIAGDRTYGGEAVPALAHRHALHASYVAWAGDDRTDAFVVDAPLPADLAALLDA